jgi:hypothetical protein
MALAVLVGSARADESHAVALWTKTARPGEAITLFGGGRDLSDGIRVTGWTADGEQAQAAEVRRLSEYTLTLRIPATMPPASLYRVQVGASPPVTVNAPEIWWIGPDMAGPGAEVAIFGRNLSLTGVMPDVTITPSAGGAPVRPDLTDATSFRLVLRLPDTLAPGTYNVTVGNGAAGPAERATGTVQVDPRSTVRWDAPGSPEVSGAAFGAVPDDGKDDRAALTAALAEAARLAHLDGPTGFATVRLAAGVYDLSAPVLLQDRVRLLGAGAATRLQPAADFPAGDFRSSPYLLQAPEAGEDCGHDTAVKVERMTLDTAGPGRAKWAVWARTACGLDLDQLRIEAKGAQAIEAHAATRLRIANSTIIDAGSFLGRSRQVFVDRNSFFGTNQGTANLLTAGAHQVAVTGNQARHLESAPTAATVRTEAYQGRFFVAQTHWGWPREHYIARNVTHDLGIHAKLANSGLDPNSGEQILFEGAGAVVPLDLSADRLIHATPDALILRPNGTALPAPGLFVVTAGTGRGIAVPVKSYDPASGVLRFREPLPILPDATTKAVVSQAPYRIAVVENRLDGRAENVETASESASAAIQVYPGGHDFAIEGNVLSDQRRAISVFAFPVEGTFVGASGWDIRNNLFQNVREGILFQLFEQGFRPEEKFATAFGLTRAINVVDIRGNDLSGAHDLPIARVGAAVRAIDALSVTDNDMGIRPTAGIMADREIAQVVPTDRLADPDLLLTRPIRAIGLEADGSGLVALADRSGGLAVRGSAGATGAEALVAIKDAAGNRGRLEVPVIVIPRTAMRAGFDHTGPPDRGLAWNNARLHDTAGGAALGYVATSPTALTVFEGGPGGLALSSGRPFTLLSARLSSAHRDNFQVLVRAFSDPAGRTEIGRKHVILNRGRARLILFTQPDRGTFRRARLVRLEPDLDGDWRIPAFGMDDLVYLTAD